jgi:hypothetical protein
MKGMRRTHGAAFNVKVAFAAFKDDKTPAELATQFGVHPAQVTKWKQHLLAWAIEVFDRTKSKSDGRIPRFSSWTAYVSGGAYASNSPFFITTHQKTTHLL